MDSIFPISCSVLWFLVPCTVRSFWCLIEIIVLHSICLYHNVMYCRGECITCMRRFGCDGAAWAIKADRALLQRLDWSCLCLSATSLLQAGCHQSSSHLVIVIIIIIPSSYHHLIIISSSIIMTTNNIASLSSSPPWQIEEHYGQCASPGACDSTSLTVAIRCVSTSTSTPSDAASLLFISGVYCRQPPPVTTSPSSSAPTASPTASPTWTYTLERRSEVVPVNPEWAVLLPGEQWYLSTTMTTQLRLILLPLTCCLLISSCSWLTTYTGARVATLRSPAHEGAMIRVHVKEGMIHIRVLNT